ncbi:hypothetical protein ACIBHX_51570 [Nonomuraea sp. NPDC050536]|uniref:hypothetical protein n=1 Tax=Nonomuraea sp. NPDC050536 TaxID=3364366 RepID=UPI0037CA9B6A
MTDLPVYVWLIVFVEAAAMPLATSAALFRGAVATGFGRPRAAAIAIGFSALWLGWMAASALLAASGAFRQDAAAANPWVPVAAVGALAVPLLMSRIPAIARILAHPATAARLTFPQTFRVIGLAFLLAMAVGALPPLFAIPAGLGDIAVGLRAPSIAKRIARGTAGRGAILFQLLGMLDLVVAITLGVLTALGPTRLITTQPSSLAISVLPLSMIITTVVPLAIALHVIALRQLRQQARSRTAEPVLVQPA